MLDGHLEPSGLKTVFVDKPHNFNHLSRYYSHDIDLTNRSADELLSATHLATKFAFLAESGSAAKSII